MAHSKETAEALLKIAQQLELSRQLSSTPFGLPNFAGYEAARLKGEIAFFEAMGVKCKPLNPAESVRHKGKVFTLSKADSKDEAPEWRMIEHKALGSETVYRYTNGVRVQ